MNIAIARNRIPDPSLSRAQIAGRLSLVEHSALTVTAKQGLTVYVRAGSIWIAEARNEIEIDWLQPATERLSPGLEPLTLTV